MDKKKAEAFRKKWKTPPRTLFDSPGKQKADATAANNIAAIRFRDPQKGLEYLGRDLATDANVGWKEYWLFLDCFVDLCSEDGLFALETYLSNKVAHEYNIDSDSSDVKIFSPPRPPKAANPTPPNNHHHVNLSPSAASPISDLCNAFQACNLHENSFGGKARANPARAHRAAEFVSNCQTAESIIGTLCKPDISPFLCVEKSCQLFANRILNDILFLAESDGGGASTGILENQIKQLQSLMSSYNDDGRFGAVDFRLAHSRIGTLVGRKLKRELRTAKGRDSPDLVDVRNNLESWLNNYNKTIDCFSSDDEDVVHVQRLDYRQQQRRSFSPKKTAHKSTVICLIESILGRLSTSSTSEGEEEDPEDAAEVIVSTEEECVAAWNGVSPCTCSWDLLFWDRFAKKKGSSSSSSKKKGANSSHKKHDAFRLAATNYAGRKLNFSDSCKRS